MRFRHPGSGGGACGLWPTVEEQEVEAEAVEHGSAGGAKGRPRRQAKDREPYV